MEGSKSRCRENVENGAVIIDNVSCHPDLARGTPYIHPKTTASSHAHSALGIITVSIPPIPAMLVTNSTVRGIISVWQLNGFVPFKDTDSIKQRGWGGREQLESEDTLYSMLLRLWRDGVREEERSGATARRISCKGVEESIIDIREVSANERVSFRRP